MARIRKLRGTTSRKSKSIKLRRNKNMAKRKTVRRRKRTGNLGGIMATGLGIGGYILFESMIEPRLIAMANITNPLIVNVVELAAGLYLSRMSGVLGNVGKAAVVINLYQILHPYLSGISASAGTPNGLFN
jgi:hypothetical protein